MFLIDIAAIQEETAVCGGKGAQERDRVVPRSTVVVRKGNGKRTRARRDSGKCRFLKFLGARPVFCAFVVAHVVNP